MYVNIFNVDDIVSSLHVCDMTHLFNLVSNKRKRALSLSRTLTTSCQSIEYHCVL